MVGDGHGVHPHGLRMLRELVETASAVKQRELGMKMQMNELRRSHWREKEFSRPSPTTNPRPSPKRKPGPSAKSRLRPRRPAVIARAIMPYLTRPAFSDSLCP